MNGTCSAEGVQCGGCSELVGQVAIVAVARERSRLGGSDGAVQAAGMGGSRALHPGCAPVPPVPPCTPHRA